MTQPAGPLPQGKYLLVEANEKCDQCGDTIYTGSIILQTRRGSKVIITLCIECIAQWAENMTGWKVLRTLQQWKMQALTAAAIREGRTGR